ncbi:MAG: metallophosphoesterase family protein [Akkermansia sp.]|nr:metallophosphoesterase family protein [Akkermansia sp.]
MRAALVSDIHDNTANMQRAVELALQQGCTRMLCMGDMVRSATFAALRAAWPAHLQLDLVFGNNEFEHDSFRTQAESYPCTTLHGFSGELELGGRRVYFTHLPAQAEKALMFGRYDAVFFGHTHQAFNRCSGSTLVCNPGEILGRGGHPSLAVYDTAANTAAILPL